MYQFKNEKKEIEFSNYNTPTPWMNYLSNGTFHTMISQAGGGVAFYKSPQIWRINHYRFFHLPTDRSGFYTYIKDGADVWCPTCEPCPAKPEKWSGTHGMGYTRFCAGKNGVKAESLYFVGKYENALIWNLKLTSDTDKKVTLFPYVELGMMEFMRELQWQCYNKHQMACYCLEEYSGEGDKPIADTVLVYRYGVETQPKPDETPLVYFAASVPVTSFDCDRDEFVGSYRSEENPIRVEEGATVEDCKATYAANAEFTVENINDREKVLLKAVLINKDGIEITRNEINVEVFADVEIQENNDVILIEKLPVGTHEIAGETVTVKPCGMLPLHFVSRKTGHKSVVEFEEKDFSYWYNKKEDMITPLLESTFTASGFTPILISGNLDDNNKWNQAFVCAEKYYEGKRYVICQVDLRQENPVAKRFLKNIMKP